MKLILKKAKIIDTAWSSKERYDIAIKNGKIESIASKLDLPGYKEVTSKNLHVSIGFLDIGTQIGEPGLEHRETISSITQAAIAGGYTGIAPFPNTSPSIHSKSEVQFIVNNTKNSIVDFHPIGAVSQSCKGEDITEFIDMKQSGAIAFSDGKHSLKDAGLMKRALQYAKACNGLIINHPDEISLSNYGQINEGEISVMLGLEGNPEMAEVLGIQRDIQLCEYTEGRYCAYNISTTEAAKLVKKHKGSQRINISSTVSYLNLIFSDKAMLGFDVNLKVYPPFRGEKDRRSLIKALKDDSIDCITSGHVPLEVELKKKSFAFADFGAIGIETVLSALLTDLEGQLEVDDIVKKLTIGPRTLLGLTIPTIEEGVEANICLFDPDLEWTFSKSDIRSLSKNSPYINKSFKGKVLGVINNNKYQF